MVNASPIGDPKDADLKQDLLRKCTIWMYNTKYSENPSEDKGDEKKTKNKEVIRKQHEDGGYAKGRWDRIKPRVWVFTGYFNTLLKPPTADGTPKIKRRVTINDEDRIFCVVGSTSAGDIWEQEFLKKKTGQNMSLMDIARLIQDTYQELRLTVDGVIMELERVEVDNVPVEVPKEADTNFDPPKNHPVIKYYDHYPILPGDKANTANVGHVRLIGPLEPGEHIIDFYARAPGHSPTGDIQYQIDVRYYVTVE